MGRALYWIVLWLAMVASICLAGALLGAILFPLGGRLLSMDLPLGEMARNGLLDGGFLALIWAPGVALVACFMIGHRRRAKSGKTGPNALDT